MSFISSHSRLLLVAVSCSVLGAGASAIATAGASTARPAKPASGSASSKGHRTGDLRRLARRAVNGDLVVKTATGFATVSFERGKLDSVNGRQLTIAEGTKKATYKTVTVTVPANAVVRDDRHKATLSALKAGQRVVVLQAPKRTFVIARTPKGG
jgi:hypothetical protein